MFGLQMGRMGRSSSGRTLAGQVRAMYAAGEQGAWYDPSDWSTLFQDSAGTTPVTAVGQPVGLMLDKRLGSVQGVELVANGDFSAGATGWTLGAGWSIAGGVATGAGGGAIYCPSTLYVPGKTYAVTVTKTGPATLVAFVRGGVSGSSPAIGVVTLILTAGTGAAGVEFYLSNGSIDNISVREIPGNPTLQATVTARPLAKSAPARIDFDGVDDVHVVTFPSALGSACTVALSIPGSGAQILTSQTIGTSYSVNTDHCGLMIINRALTAAETNAVTRYLNTKAVP